MAPADSEILALRDASIEVALRGSGPCIVLLHGIEGPRVSAPLADRLARHAHVVAPTHPGFGAAPLPSWFDGVDDLSYLYLDMFEQLKLHDIVLVGSGLGGWLAAEIATKCTRQISRIVLIGAVGIKAGDRETRDIPDIYALAPAAVTQLLYHDPKNAPEISAFSDEDLEQLVRIREAAALYLWEPYMHNPKLRRRLHRIDVPVLYLRGESDGIVSGAYAQAYCAALADARTDVIEKAGHFPEMEQPEMVARKILEFAALPSSRTARVQAKSA